ncbi:MAG: hypothetical protein WC956_10280 [bacterium]
MKQIAIIICLVLLASCAAKAPSRRAVQVEGKRTTEAANLEKRLLAFHDATPSVKGLAWVEFFSGDEERRTEAAVAIERPAQIRIDAMDALADVWAQAGSDGQRLWLFIPSKRKLYEGRATARTLHKLAKFDWEPSELVAIVAGAPPLGDEPGILQVGPDRDLHFVAQGSGLHIWTDGSKGRVAKCIRFAGDGKTKDYEISFSGYRREGKVDFPHKIEASFPGRGARILIEYRDVELASPIEAAAFQPPPRAGRSEKLSGE